MIKSNSLSPKLMSIICVPLRYKGTLGMRDHELVLVVKHFCSHFFSNNFFEGFPLHFFRIQRKSKNIWLKTWFGYICQQ